MPPNMATLGCIDAGMLSSSSSKGEDDAANQLGSCSYRLDRWMAGPRHLVHDFLPPVAARSGLDCRRFGDPRWQAADSRRADDRLAAPGIAHGADSRET